MIVIRSWAAILVFTCLLGACEGPEGPLGPEGPRGPVGPVGEQGPTGSLDISAHDVIISPTDFVEIDETLEAAVYRIPAITERVVAEGAVLAYTNRRIPGVWVALPVIDDSILLGFGFSPGVGILELTRPAGTRPAANRFGSYQVRLLFFRHQPPRYWSMWTRKTIRQSCHSTLHPRWLNRVPTFSRCARKQCWARERPVG